MFLEAETSFGLQFLQTLPLNESSIFSPLSIALALSLVHAGAKGDTKSQITNTLLKGSNDEQFTQHFSFISDAIQNKKDGVFTNVANRVFLSKTFTAEKSYLDLVKKNYNAGAESLDFSKSDAADKINAFVRKATENKIDNLVGSDALKDAVALLVNAVYFEGEWSDNFSEFSTSDEDFSTADGKSKKTSFMKDHRSDRTYSSDDIFQVLTLEYSDTSYKFAIFLPKVKNDLKNSMKKLDAARIQKLVKDGKSTFINTEIPKFKIEKELELKDVLMKLGIKQMFTDSADLSGIAKNIKISEGIHKAMIQINEKGTIAAAATGMKAVPMSLRMETPVEFKANHPFLFALLKDNHPLFLGTYQG